MLAVVTLILVSIGTVMIYSSSSIIAVDHYNDSLHFIKKQIIMVVLGLLAMMVTTFVPYRWWRHFAYGGVVLSAILLALLLIPGFGVTAGKATRWLSLGFMRFQVSELVKIGLVLFFAHYIAKKEDRIGRLAFFPVPLFILAACDFMILKQPDFGAAMIIAAVFMAMLFLAGCRVSHLLAITALTVPVGVFLIMSGGYRLARLQVFLDPWKDPLKSGFQIIQSFISFGSGGPFGVGIGSGMQKLYYLPEPHTDFILSVIAEEGGFLFVGAIIGLFLVLIVRGFMIAFRAQDLFGSLLAAGLVTVIGLEAFINMAGVMGLIPLKGLVLPFVSYGGSSLVTSMAAVGILLNISGYRAESSISRRQGARQ